MGRVVHTLAIIAAVAVNFIPGIGQLASVAIQIGLAGLAAATAPHPKASKASFQGSVSQIVIGANMPLPYAMGRTFVGGNLVYDVGYGGTNNSDRSQVFVYSAAGPIDSFESFQGDFSDVGVAVSGGTFPSVAASGFYSGYLWVDARKGARPDTALASPSGRPAVTGWGSTYKLSGLASAMVTMKFDDQGKIWSSGLPQWGAVFKGVLVYDPRLDSTYPGGSGSQRWTDESTWTWSDNPALHALTYARGRYVGTVRMIGAGIPQASIDIPSFVALANVCTTNAWKVGGSIYEGPNLSKWDNLKKILEAAASEPAWVAGVLTCVVSAPKTSLDTITNDDLADGELRLQTSKSWRDRINTVVPRYRSEAHKWDYVQADAVSGSAYITEDGEAKTQEVQYDLVQTATHAAKLAGYAIVNSREFGPITLTLKPRLMAYYPGEALTINLPELGLVSQLAMITDRKVNPDNGTVSLTFVSETTAKHAFALGKTGTAPPTPSITSPSTMDALAQANADQDSIGPNDLIDDTFLPSFWNLDAGAVRVARNNAGGFAYGYSNFALEQPIPNSATAVLGETNTFPRRNTVTPGQQYYVTAWVQKTSGASNCPLYIGLRWFDSAGTQIGTSIARTFNSSELVGGGGPVAYSVGGPAPSNAATATMFTSVQPIASPTGSIRWERPIFSNLEPGADVTSFIEGGGNLLFKHASNGTPEAGEYPRDLYYALKSTLGPVTAGVTWDCIIIDGSLNGASAGTTVYPLTAGDVPINSLETDSATLVLHAYKNSVVRSKTITFTKVYSPPPPSGGTTGGSTAGGSQASGFTPFSTTGYTAVSSTIAITLAGAGSVTCTVNLTARPSKTGGVGSWSNTLKVQHETSPGSGTWVDVAATTGSGGPLASSVQSGDIDVGTNVTTATPSNFAFAAQLTGLAAGAHNFRVVGVTSSSPTAARIHNVTGSVSLATP